MREIGLIRNVIPISRSFALGSKKPPIVEQRSWTYHGMGCCRWLPAALNMRRQADPVPAHRVRAAVRQRITAFNFCHRHRNHRLLSQRQFILRMNPR